MILKPFDPEVTLRVVGSIGVAILIDSGLVLCMSLCQFPCDYFSEVCVSLATASAMVCARVASLASWSRLWSLWLSQWPSCASEAAVSPSLVLSLFSIMLVGGSMVLKEVEVSQITNVLSYLIFSSVVQVDVAWSRSAFQVPFKSIKNKLSSYVSNMLWQMVSKEV